MEVLKRCRKSETGDMFFVMAVIFGFAIFMIILAYAYSQVEPKISEGLANSATPEAAVNSTKILSQAATAITRVNVLFPLLIAGLIGFVLISALFFRSHPAFLFIGLIVLGVALILAAIFSNVYQTITADATFEDVTDDFNVMTVFLENLPLIILIVFIATAIILYIKPGGAGGQY